MRGVLSCVFVWCCVCSVCECFAYYVLCVVSAVCCVLLREVLQAQHAQVHRRCRPRLLVVLCCLVLGGILEGEGCVS